MVFGDSPMPNAYNKGVGTAYYLDFNPINNSVVYLYPEYRTEEIPLSYINHGFIGKFDSRFQDRLMLLKNALNWRSVGSVDSIQEGSTYCGWEYFVEYKDGPDYKYYSVTQAVSDTLDMFFDFLRDLENSKWTRVSLNPKLVHIDDEVVVSLTRCGLYDKLEVPYLFPQCDSGVDFTKLAGRWRTVGPNHRSTEKNKFYSHTLNSDSTFRLHKYNNGKLEELTRGTYSIDSKALQIHYLSSDGNKMTQIISQLSDSCLSGFQIVNQNGKKQVKWNRY